MLDSMSIDSVSVFSAEEALDYLKHTLPDIIFLDHSMPGITGLETIKLIKSNPHTATVPVMMYTAKEGEVYVGQARALGAVDVLPKGMEKDYLVKALAKLNLISSDNSNDARKIEAFDEFEERRKFNRDDFKRPLLENEPDWKRFWRTQAEPYLDSQKGQQSDEIRYISTRQTLKITREIHQTLEQFEHALISRIEAHDDFKDHKRELEKKRSKKIVYSIAALILILQFGIVWQLLKKDGIDEQLLLIQTEQQNFNKQYNEKMSELALKLERYVEEPEIVSEEPIDEEVAQAVSLIDNFGEVIVQNLYLENIERGEYRGVTSSGYQFLVNLQGQVGWQLKMRYFQTDDCTGDVFIDSENAVVYRANDGAIWYVNKLALATEVKTGSMLNEADECTLKDEEILSLSSLERDYNMITGFDDTHILSLFFGQ